MAASSFFSRYVPPSSSSSAPGEKSDAGIPQKRKREPHTEPGTQSTASQVEEKPRKKKNTYAVTSEESYTPEKSSTFYADKHSLANGRAKSEKEDTQDESPRDTQNGRLETSGSDTGVTDTVNEPRGYPGDESKARKEKKKKKKRREEKHPPQEISENEKDVADTDIRDSTKHASLMSKFERSKSKAQKHSEHAQADEANQEEVGPNGDEIVSHGLEPLPQPAAAAETTQKPSYSTLPPWLSEPYSVPSDFMRDFSALGLNGKLLSSLKSGGFSQAFPIQSAVMTLLAPGPDYHGGDLCISAATGSGKTLAYALPLVSNIEYSPVSRLRGLIVVPTRELVKQARDSCELCATGTGLRIGTAVGSTSLKEEQQQLMEVDQVYDPAAYRRRNESRMTAEDWTRFGLQDYLADAEEFQNSLPDHIPTPSSKVDILICTPGRLVDHLRSTRGFTLEHVQWLIIDEADRLLNESFQEWVETVMPALELQRFSTPSDGSAESFLQRLGRSMSRKKIRKIVLSATMTRDITKLNSLRLDDPKLVVIDSGDKGAKTLKDNELEGTDVSETPGHGFTLPSTLREMHVSVGDGSEKPLYLLRLLLHHLKIGQENRPRRSSSTSSTSSSSSSSSSSESSADEDSSRSSSPASSDTSSSSESSERPNMTSALIFTKSSESAARLSRLLSLLHPPLSNHIGTLNKSNKSSSSRRTLAAYRQGRISIIVATDRASRGLDLPSLSHVISYDVPTSVTSYVHRIGRTARAGSEGSALTLVAHREGRWFSNEVVKGPIRRIGGDRTVKRVTVQLDDAAELKRRYSDALLQLEEQVADSTVRRPKEVENN